MRLSALIALSLSTAALSACGEDGSETADRSPTPTATVERSGDATAAREAHATEEAIEAALDTYEGGDAAKAEDQVAEAYVSHFEEVEHALGAKDPELNESLEERISGDLRAAVRAKDDAKVD